MTTTHKIKIKVAGLYCSGCAENIISLLRKKFNLEKVSADLNSKTLELSPNSKVEVIELVKAIDANGYGPASIVTN